jgi:MoxR-like ATPase
VPTAPGPGILLLDDFNRADDRILRGLMQLVQRSELMAWRLPPEWQIVATANPDRAGYSVTAVDDALLNRMLNVTLVYSAGSWARWATAAGVDPRGIEFVVAYPEAITGRRTTPRSLVQLFSLLAPIRDLRAEAELVADLAAATLDEATAAAFLRHVLDELELLPSADEVLDAGPDDEVHARIAAFARDERGLRLDRLSVLAHRLVVALSAADYEPGQRHRANLVRFLLLDVIPADLRMSLHSELLGCGEVVAEMVSDRRLAERLLEGL